MTKQFTPFLFFLFAVGTFGYAQTPTFSGKHLLHWDEQQSGSASARQSQLPMADALNAYDLYALDAQAIRKYVTAHAGPDQFQLSLGRKYRWDITIEENNLLSSDHQSYLLTPQGKQAAPAAPAVTFKGRLNTTGGGEVRLMIDGDHLEGFVTYRGKRLYLEDVEGMSDAASRTSGSQVVVYAEEAVKEGSDTKCLAVETEAYNEKVKRHANAKTANGCPAKTEVQLATFALYSRTAAAGGAQAVNNEILGIINNVQSAYDQFDILLNVVEQVVSTCAECDPWTHQGTSSSLEKFTDWAPSGFSKEHDEGICFVKAAGSGTIGTAWIASICRSSRYAVVDRLKTAGGNKILVAHEMGHNFGAGHANSGIMTSSVNSSNDSWASTSVNAINDHIATRTCLACVDGDSPDNPEEPPTASCDVPDNTAVTNLRPTTATLTWKAVSSGNSYTVRVRRKDKNQWVTFDASQNFANVRGALPGVTYQWQVRTNCTDEQSTFSKLTDFTTPTDDDPAPPGTQDKIVIRAQGETGEEQMTLRLNGQPVASWQVAQGWAEYTYEGPVAGSIRVAFTNDKSVKGQVDRNLRVDYIRVDGTLIQAEEQANNTGAWQGTCGAGSNTEWLHCNGYIDFGSSNANYAAAQWSQPTKTTAGVVYHAEKATPARSIAVLNDDLQKMKVFPNPYANSFRLSWPGSRARQVRVDIFNLGGQLVHSTQRTLASQSIELGQELIPGMYTVRVTTDGLQSETKIIKR